MEINVLQFLASKSPPLTTTTTHTHTNPVKLTNTTIQTHIFLPRCQRRFRINSTNGTSSEDSPQPVPPTITPPDTVEIRFRRGSRKQRKLRKEDVGGGQSVKAQASDNPKNWEDMSLSEKAMEVYMGEKGLLFWLNKFAYASIFIVIGGWIVFRFVGPALNIYQLDTPPLSPTSMFKG